MPELRHLRKGGYRKLLTDLLTELTDGTRSLQEVAAIVGGSLAWAADCEEGVIDEHLMANFIAGANRIKLLEWTDA